MSNYKDFSQYNQEAENIRPTGRIQLVQRILNAASVISNLGIGVPLKWANAYKSFQVLVPNEQGAPTDYTTSEAISSVDSILFEAENQLRASQDDMNTLKSEFNNIPLQGNVNFKNLTFLDKSKRYAFPAIQYNGVNYVISFATYNDGNINSSNIYINTTEGWQYIADHQQGEQLSSGNTIMICYKASESNFPVQLADVIVQSYNKYVTYFIHFECTSDRLIMYLYFRMEDANTGSISYARRACYYDLSTINLPTGTTSNPLPLSSVATGTMDGDFFSQSMNVTGQVDIDEVLGLPNPSDLIEIIDNME